jgi:hypothetical protein
MNVTTVHSLTAANAIIDASKTVLVKHLFVTLHCGEFLRLQDGTVGRLLDVDHQRILIHQYCFVPGGIMAASTVEGTSILDERVASHVASWEEADSVEDIFFLFTSSSVLSKRFSPQGIENAAYFRSFRRQDGELVNVDEESGGVEALFAGVGGYHTHSQVIFDFLTRVRLATVKVLSSKRIFVYPNVRVLLDGVNQLCWDYLQRKIRYLLGNEADEPALVFGTMRQSRYSARYTSSYLSVSVLVVTTKQQFIRVISNREVQACRKNF